MTHLVIYLLIIALAIMFIILFAYLGREVFDADGKSSAKTTRGILSRFGFPRGFKVLSNVTVKDDNGEIVIENMLIGYFGILLIRTQGARGEYYGALDAEKWTLIANNKKVSFENPVKRLQREEAALRAVFAKNKIYNIPIERLVYISSKSRKTAVYVTHGGEILLAGKLAGYLEKTKFEKDIGLDVKKIENTVLGVHTV